MISLICTIFIDLVTWNITKNKWELEKLKKCTKSIIFHFQFSFKTIKTILLLDNLNYVNFPRLFLLPRLFMTIKNVEKGKKKFKQLYVFLLFQRLSSTGGTTLIAYRFGEYHLYMDVAWNWTSKYFFNIWLLCTTGVGSFWRQRLLFKNK